MSGRFAGRTRRTTLLAAVAAVALVGSGALAWRLHAGDPVAAFLDRHWQRPLAAQGIPPPAWSALERSLSPSACGSCHAQQYEDWRHSLHSRTMGAGVAWQFRLMAQDQANRCMDCHAPLAEQKALTAQAFAWPQRPPSAPPAYVPATLADDGLVCAACHVRAHQRFGPPPRTTAASGASGPHGGFTESAAFEDSRFCAACHQFPADGPATAGKLHEDTYAQWRASRFAAENRPCQSCHMPDRRHQWQGIHSREMVLKALDIGFNVVAVNGRRIAHATLRNVGAGHAFPTYMVPRISVALVLVDRQGRDVRTLAQRIIGWRVGLDLDREEFDTRLLPGQALEFEAGVVGAAPGSSVELRVDVAPREHYERLFERSLRDDGDKLDAQTRDTLRRARAEAVATRYEALRLRRPLD